MLLIALTACLLDENKEASGPTCVDTPTDVAMDEVTPLGFAAADVLPLAEGTHGAEFTYADDGATVTTIVVTPGGTARYVDSVADYPDTGAVPAIDVLCESRVEIDATETFVTGDGAFDEAWDYVLSATEAGLVSFGGAIPDATFHGSYVLADHTTATDYDKLTASVNANFAVDTLSGSLSGQASGEDKDCVDGEACTAWAEMIEIGSWTNLPPE